MENKSVYTFSEEEIKTIVDTIELDLLTKPRVSFTLANNWNTNFPDKPGVYAIFEKGVFVYIGETADLKERMKDIRRTYLHTFRKKMGTHRLNAKLEGNLFSSEIEGKLDIYMVENLEFTCHALSFGRKEVEARIHSKHKDKLLNSISLRGTKKTE